MANRRDAKNRVLKKGEYQKKDGRYMYKYTDFNGEWRYVYSWTLTQTDRTPYGKSHGECLREKEKKISKETLDKIDIYNASKTTLNSLFDKYIEQKRELKTTTRRDYKYIYNLYVRDVIGKKKISDIKYSDLKKFYNDLIYENYLKVSSVDRINIIIYPVFSLAVRDELIRTNPAKGLIKEIKKNQCWSQEQKHSLTENEQKIFVNFLRNDSDYNKWLPLFTFLLGTGCRIGEALGLTWKDCDFENNIISINHSLVYKPEEYTNKEMFRIMTPKTKNSIREIPMLNEVREMLLDVMKGQLRNRENTVVVDGYTGFVFLNKNGNLHQNSNINRVLIRIVNKYNSQEKNNAETEGRIPEYLPHISAHTFRHTFCTMLCKNERDLKIIQTIMGHSNISTTMDIYNEVTRERKQVSFMNLSGKIFIG